MTWRGNTRAPLTDQRVFPRIDAGSLVTWVGVGGTPESVVRAARFGMPLMLSIIGGDPARFAPLVDCIAERSSSSASPRCRSGCIRRATSRTPTQQARDELFPHFKALRDRIGAERGWRGAMSRADFEREVEHGSLYVGAPDTVARKIAATARKFRLARFNLKYSAGTLPHEKLMRCIELYGSHVIRLVREKLADAGGLPSEPAAAGASAAPQSTCTSGRSARSRAAPAAVTPVCHRKSSRSDAMPRALDGGVRDTGVAVQIQVLSSRRARERSKPASVSGCARAASASRRAARRSLSSPASSSAVPARFKSTISPAAAASASSAGASSAVPGELGLTTSRASVCDTCRASKPAAARCATSRGSAVALPGSVAVAARRAEAELGASSGSTVGGAPTAPTVVRAARRRRPTSSGSRPARPSAASCLRPA